MTRIFVGIGPVFSEVDNLGEEFSVTSVQDIPWLGATVFARRPIVLHENWALTSVDAR